MPDLLIHCSVFRHQCHLFSVPVVYTVVLVLCLCFPVVKTTVFLSDMSYYDVVNTIYKKCMYHPFCLCVIITCMHTQAIDRNKQCSVTCLCVVITCMHIQTIDPNKQHSVTCLCVIITCMHTQTIDPQQTTFGYMFVCNNYLYAHSNHRPQQTMFSYMFVCNNYLYAHSRHRLQQTTFGYMFACNNDLYAHFNHRP